MGLLVVFDTAVLYAELLCMHVPMCGLCCTVAVQRCTVTAETLRRTQWNDENEFLELY